MVIHPTLDLAEASGRQWDIITIGAGPAGSLAARELARRGKKVLLVDKSRFPRPKVCGCCINPRALATLSSVGLAGLVERCGAKPLQQLRLAAHGWQAKVPVGGRALSRDVFDAALVDAAIQAGAHFLPETHGRLGNDNSHHAERDEYFVNTRSVCLRSAGAEGCQEVLVSAGLVLGADGLGSRLLADEPDHRSSVDSGSRLGGGAFVEKFPDFYEDGSIFMACGKGGYVGLVRVEDTRLNVAAAFDGAFVKQAGGLGRAAAAVLQEAGLPAITGLDGPSWHGTPLLTRSIEPPAAERVFLLGDAAGYVEPFTGEGMAWALSCGAAVVPLALRCHGRWDASYIRQWTVLHRQLIGRRQWVCRAVANVLRRPRLVGLIVPALACFPWLAAPVVRYLN